jgi:hypothetical protein
MYLLPPGGAKVRVLVAIEAALAPILLAIAVPPLPQLLTRDGRKPRHTAQPTRELGGGAPPQ